MNKIKVFFKNKFVLIILVVFVFIFSLPYLLYFYGLSLVKNFPQPPKEIVLKEEEKKEIFKDNTCNNFKKISPWKIIYDIIFSNKNKEYCQNNYERMISILAKENIIFEKPDYLKRNLSQVSYSIYISNNWSEDRILSEFYKMYFKEKERKVFKIAEKEAIKVLGEEEYNIEKPFKLERFKAGDREDAYSNSVLRELNLSKKEYIWYFHGTLCDENITCLDNVIKIFVSDKDLKILKIDYDI